MMPSENETPLAMRFLAAMLTLATSASLPAEPRQAPERAEPVASTATARILRAAIVSRPSEGKPSPPPDAPVPATRRDRDGTQWTEFP